MGSLQQQSVLKGRNVPSRRQEATVHQIFSTVADKQGDRTAILYEDEHGFVHSISYKVLDRSSNRLAHVLAQYWRNERDHDCLIAICMKPTFRLPVVLTSVLKAGMAYLPLDSEFPAARIKHILNDARPVLIVVDDDVDTTHFEGCETKTYRELMAEASNFPEEPVEIANIPEQLAIVLYTSGSTGIPKGVRIPHATLLNRLEWQWRELPYLPTEECCVFKTALTFVDSAPEIWGPLLQGRTIVVVPREITKNPEKLVAVLDKYRIHRLILVPSLLRSLLMYLSLQKNNMLTTLEIWICSGETLPTTLANQFFTRFANCNKILANFYGSTEVMGDVTYHLLNDRNELQNLDKVPIGKPIDNSIIYIVNKDLCLVPHGEVGELAIAGRNLAAGYIRNNNSNKFMDNPHAIDAEYSKMFRTGDYARIVNGVVMYEGRTDSQVKIRGHRIDLAEVEKIISELNILDKVVVLCYKAGELSQILLAFVTLKENAITSQQQIEHFLRSSMPAYMVPEIIIMDSIPLLVNGKTDRQALLKTYELSKINHNAPEMECDYYGVPEDYMARAKVLFTTVASVIGRSDHTVDVNSNFYELGGNSLNSIYTVTKLRDLGFCISITDFITAKSMADILTKMEPTTDDYSFEDTDNSLDYIVEQLADEHKEDVIEMITDSFYSKADLEQWILQDINRNDYRILMEKLWEPLVEKGFSFVLKSADGSMVLAVALNFDARDEPEVEIDSKLVIVFDFLEYLEQPIRETRLPKGLGKLYHSFMMATNKDLTPAENVILMKEMERHCLLVARKNNFAGIFTTNTSPLTQQLGIDVYKYEVLLDYQVNQYTAPDGSKPFGRAPDHQRAICSWKSIQ